MISLKELKYVGVYSHKSPYPGDGYAKETLENMIQIYEKYNKDYKGKDYSIIFSDSSELNFEIFESNVCHMLGIDFNNFTGGYNNYDIFLEEVLGIDKKNNRISSYALVEKILQNYEEVIKYDSTAENRVINYYKARVKCAIFDKISDFEKFRFSKLETADESKLLFTPSNEAICPYFLIRLTPDAHHGKYCVSSLLAPEKNNLPDYFTYFASIPTQMIIDDNLSKLSKIEATPKEKIELLNMYKSIMLTYSLTDKMDISGDYVALLAELDNKKKRKTL